MDDGLVRGGSAAPSSYELGEYLLERLIEYNEVKHLEEYIVIATLRASRAKQTLRDASSAKLLSGVHGQRKFLDIALDLLHRM